LRTELGMTSLGIVGFGHIGHTLALRAKAFGMTVSVANRSPVSASDVVDRAYALSELPALMGSVDAVVNTLPLTDETRGLIGAAELAAMRPDAVILNVGRGAVIEQGALYDALRAKRIDGAIIDTWYVYPNAEDESPLPAQLPFHELGNVTMTPHMSGWTYGTIHRRRATIADNLNRCAVGKELRNRIR
jgi:phosphoglycerate dehydrogenase-like enzyme